MRKTASLFFAASMVAFAGCGDTPGDVSERECSDEECGPGPGAASIMCEDGSFAGPVCLRNENGLCSWQFTSCPEGSCDPDNSQYETAGCECETSESCTCQVFTGAMFLPEAQQSVCDSETNTCIPCLYL